jgi:hypothetical protein
VVQDLLFKLYTIFSVLRKGRCEEVNISVAKEFCGGVRDVKRWLEIRAVVQIQDTVFVP